MKWWPGGGFWYVHQMNCIFNVYMSTQIIISALFSGNNDWITSLHSLDPKSILPLIWSMCFNKFVQRYSVSLIYMDVWNIWAVFSHTMLYCISEKVTLMPAQWWKPIKKPEDDCKSKVTPSVLSRWNENLFSFYGGSFTK